MGDLMLMRVTPTQVLRDWLLKNTDSLRLQPERDIILGARLELGTQIAGMDNGDIAWEIHEWAKTHSFLPTARDGVPSFVVPSSDGATPMRAGDSEALDKLKSLLKTLGAVPTELKWEGDGTSAAISASGLTAAFNQGKTEVGVGWDRTVEFKTDASGMTFSAQIDPQNKNWSMSLMIGRQAPNLADVANVFKQGEGAVRGVLSNMDKIDLRDPGKTKSQFTPYLNPIKDAVDAAGKIAAQRPGDISFGVSLKGGLPGAQGGGGVTATALFTVVF